MQLDRIELADIHAPQLLARKLHQQLGAIGAPVPVTEIARALDIEEVRLQPFDGFEGMLLTDTVRSRGAILANTRRGDRGVRFTVAHELGHFLMEWHKFSAESGFTCQISDLQATGEGRWHLRQETQANQFAIELLAPRHLFDEHLNDAPDLRDAQCARDALDISLEAAVRRMVDRHPEQLAAVWSKDGCIRYFHRSKTFPWIDRARGDRIASATKATRAISNGKRGFTEMTEAHPLAWIKNSDTELWEQTRVGKGGHAVTLLWAERPNQIEDEESDLAELGVPGFR